MSISVNNRPIRINVGGGRRTVQISSGASRAIEANRPQTDVVVERPQTQVRIDDKTARRVDTGGKQGLPGRDGQDAGNIERTTDTPISGHTVVRSVTAQAVEITDATNPEHGDDTLGITTNAAAPGDTLSIQRGGAITFNGWAWIPLRPVYLGSIPGSLTQTPPEPEAGFAFSQVFGYAESETSIIIEIQPPIYF